MGGALESPVLVEAGGCKSDLPWLLKRSALPI